MSVSRKISQLEVSATPPAFSSAGRWHGANRTGELRRSIRGVWMFRPVERSMTVSAPQRIAHTSLSTSRGRRGHRELPMLALIFTRSCDRMIIARIPGDSRSQE